MSMDERLPYPGLRAYHRDESDVFFGREGCVDDMVERLAATRFLAVLGASGSGKSSLVRTGLLDALELGFHARAGSRWMVADCHPGGQPMRNLAAALLAASGKPSIDELDLSVLESFLRRGPLAVAEWCADGHLPAPCNLLLLVDQFEELFRYGDYAGREEAEAFVALLLESAGSDAPIHVVITMRSEYLGACALLPRLAEQINAGLYLTRRMTREECRQAIEGPAGVVGFDIEPRLVNRLLNDLSSFAPWESDTEGSQLQRLSRRADQLPLMQHVLSRLWQVARKTDTERPCLTLDDYESIGALQGALDAHAEEVATRLSDAAKPLVRGVFRALISGTNLSDAVRRPRRFADVVAAVGADRALVAGVVEAYRANDCNFLLPSLPTPIGDDTIVDISHESLIRQWSSLAAWLIEEARAAALWQRLVNAQTRHERSEGDRLRGLDLANILAWWERERPNAAWAKGQGGDYAKVVAFLEESRQADEEEIRRKEEVAARERRRLRARAAIYAGLAIVASISSGFALWSNDNLAKETERAETARAVAEKANDMAISAADHFLTNLAERLRRTLGVPREEVDQLFKEGEDFLNDLANQTGDHAGLARARARLLLTFADVSADRDEPAGMETRVLTARDLLLRGRLEASLDDRDLGLLAESYIQESRLYELADRNDRAEAAARQANLIAQRISSKGDDTILQQAKVLYYLSGTQGINKKNKEGAASAHECVDLLTGASFSTLHSARDYLEARCHARLGWHYDAIAKDKLVSTHEEEALDIIARTPVEARDVRTLMLEAILENNRGWALNKRGDLDAARKRYENAVRTMRMISDSNPTDHSARNNLAFSMSNVGHVLLEQNAYRQALEWLESALQERDQLGERWRDSHDYGERLDRLLVDLLTTIGAITGWEQDSELLARYIAYAKRRIEVQSHFLAQAREKLCRSCLLLTKMNLAYALSRTDLQLVEGRQQQILATVDEIASDSKKIVAGSVSGKDVINAKRAWLWSVSYLPADVTEVPSATDDVARIAVLEGSRQRQVAFLAQFPGAWLIEERLGRTLWSLAKLYAQAGKPEEAVQAAERSAALYSKDAVQLLADWNATGSGPVVRDVQKAERYTSLLQSRNWKKTGFSARVDLLWTDQDDNSNHSIYLTDPRDDQDDPVDRLLWQTEQLEGVRLYGQTVEYLRAHLQTAKAERVSFVDRVTVAVTNPASPADRIASKMREHLYDKNDATGLKELLEQEWSKQGGPEGVRVAVAHVVDDRAASDPTDALFSTAVDLHAAGRSEIAVVVYDALIAAGRAPPNMLAEILRTRSFARSQSSDFEGAEKDVLLALALKPGDPEILNHLAYNWVELDRMLPAAVSILEHAAATKPDDPNIKDSLGWAYVKSGRIETGFALINEAAQAAQAKPEEAEILAHLADTYRRLGREDEAKSTFELARARATDDRVLGFIARQQRLMGVGTPSPPSEEAAAAAARLLAGAGAEKRIGISTDAAGLAIRGYDAVAYFTDREPTPGNLRHFAVWQGALWLFASADHRDRFLAEPERYAPAYGGHCGYCAAVDHKRHGLPHAWAIRNGRLFLHMSFELRHTWEEMPEKYIKDADERWPALREQMISVDDSSTYTEALLAALQKVSAGAQ
jgi:tetratricopeptide (TPR) repeat protein